MKTTANIRNLRNMLLLPVIIVSAIGVLFLVLSMFFYSQKLSVIGGIVLIFMLFVMSIFYYKLLNPVSNFVISLKSISNGNLHIDTDAIGNNQLCEIVSSLCEIIKKSTEIQKEVYENGNVFANSYKEVHNSFQMLNKTTEKISYAVADITKGVDDQAYAIEKGTGSVKDIICGLEELSTDIEKSDEHSIQTKIMVNIVNEAIKFNQIKMEEYKQVFSNLSGAISNMANNSKEIGIVLDVISQIADRTGLLSLNASIEAVRVGKHGNGFAVVADEIRKLSEESGQSIEKINEIIKEVQSSIEKSVGEISKTEHAIKEQEISLNETGNAFNEICKIVEDSYNNLRFVSVAANVFKKNAALIGDQFSELASFSQQSAANMHEISESAEEQVLTTQLISESSKELFGIVHGFKAAVSEKM